MVVADNRGTAHYTEIVYHSMSKAILKLLTLQETKGDKENFDRSSGSVLKASYEPRRKPRPIIEVLR